MAFILLERNDWVWVSYPKEPKLGLVLAVREHTVVLRMLVGSRQLQASREVVSKRLLSKAELSEEEIQQLPCGKRPLVLGRAKQIVAVNRIFTDNPNRKERRVYYCRRCEAFHTTAQFKIPVELLMKLRSFPYIPDEREDYAKGRARKKVWRWLKDIIGIRVPYRIFDYSLLGYGDGNRKNAVVKILLDPLDYLHYLFLFLYMRRKERLAKQETAN
ncbi:hypothetical protein [Sphingobacterium wenxiniae]|uniref:Uncharacterized protein n=1 Tax=Sphingobacterium wenxiniae TaxID=683125 RepID=A0A1I6QAB7_9SPHI|nr:hypothetical protein [Sphingobacterium wenxiniae]SFS49295.1 hypothetical protein SAMN05660206_102219 [Sphingobacterium wenxiniae]